MKYEFITGHRSTLRVKKMCQVLMVSRSGYYDCLGRGQSQRDRSNKVLLKQIEKAYRGSRGTYGSPRITAELRVNGDNCNKKRVARLMRTNGIIAKTWRRFKVTTDSGHNKPVVANLINRRFEAEKPNRLWSSDITYIWTNEGWLYLSVVLDVYSRRIVGWSMNRRLTKDLVLDAVNVGLDMATFNVEGGRLVGVPAEGPAKVDVSPFGGAQLEINGAELVLAGRVTDGTAAFENNVIACPGPP